jgi:predicted dehydrogenase
MLSSVKLNAVVVATHADTHYEITMEALSHGLHVLCEKPMADCVENCQRMVETAEKNNRLLAINFNTRSAPELRTVKQLIDTGEIGKIRVVWFVYDWSAHQWQPPERLEHFMRNGGPIIDSAVHYFEGIRWYTGQEFKRIDAKGVFLSPYDAPQHALTTCGSMERLPWWKSAGSLPADQGSRLDPEYYGHRRRRHDRL